MAIFDIIEKIIYINTIIILNDYGLRKYSCLNVASGEVEVTEKKRLWIGNDVGYCKQKIIQNW